MKISKKAMQVKPSATLSVFAEAKKIQLTGEHVINFGVGEPDFISPPPALFYAKRAIDNGKTHYNPVSGLPELKIEVCNYYQSRFGLNFSPSDVIIGTGVKPLLFEALYSLLDTNDEVVVFTPAWVSYVEQIRLCGGKEVLIDTTRNSFQPDIEVLHKSINSKTVGIIINNPCNPTGAVYSSSSLNAIADIALEKDIWIIYDEIYERLVYGEEKYHNILKLRPDLKNNVILMNGVSKAFAMTGWRIGYALGPEEIISRMISIQGHITSDAASISQWASVGALKEADPDVENMRNEFAMRRDLILELLAEIPYISFNQPKGTFYVFLDIKDCLGKHHDQILLEDDISFCSTLLKSKKVATVPGSAFMAPGFLRISYANSREDILEGMRKLRQYLEELS